MSKKKRDPQIPSRESIETDLAKMVTLGLAEIVPGKDGKPGFRLTAKGTARVEKLMADALKKKGGE